MASTLVFGLALTSCASTREVPKPAPESVGEEPSDGADEEKSPEPDGSRRSRVPKRRMASKAQAKQPAAPTPLAQAAPAVAQSNRCVTGQVRARGEIVVPVKNATVSLFKGPALLGETRTDENGKFAWCAGPNLSGERFEITVRVSKAPFQTISQSRDWKVGTQEEFDFALIAEGL